MLTKDEILELYEEINQPYTEAEFAKHSEDRIIKSWLEITHAHNYDLIRLLLRWRAYLDGKGEKPERKLYVMLRPGKNNDNAACARLHDIADYFAQFDHGHTPLLPILVYCSRSSLTLVNFLDDFFASPHLTEANHHIKEFFTLASYHGKPQMTREEFRKALFDEINAFISECSEYAKDLTVYMSTRAKEITDGNKPATPEDVKKIVTRAKNELKTTIREATNGKMKTFHHPKKAYDKVLQQIISHLAKPGITFSLHNACRLFTADKKQFTTVYAWCHRHEKDIHQAVELQKTLQNSR